MNGSPTSIVGVVADEKVNNLDDKSDNPGVYVSNEQSPAFFQAVIVRAATDPSLLQQAIRKAVHDVIKAQPLTDVKPLNQINPDPMAPTGWRPILPALFAGIAGWL